MISVLKKNHTNSTENSRVLRTQIPQMLTFTTFECRFLNSNDPFSWKEALLTCPPTTPSFGGWVCSSGRVSGCFGRWLGLKLSNQCSHEGPLLDKGFGWGWRMGNKARIKPPTPGHSEILVGLFKKPTNVLLHERAGISVLGSIRPRSKAARGKRSKVHWPDDGFCKTAVLNSVGRVGSKFDTLFFPRQPLDIWQCPETFLVVTTVI